jgi:hypothetical protein
MMALWGEGGGHMFARLRRFYRPAETPLAAMGGPCHLLRTDEVYDRVPLGAVLRKCAVTLPPDAREGAPGAAGGAGALPAYVCVAQLDLEVMMAGALPPGCGIPPAAAGG